MLLVWEAYCQLMNLKVKLQCLLVEIILTLNWWKISFTISQYLIFINVILIYLKMTFDEIVDILHIQYLHDNLSSSTTQRIRDNLNIWNLFPTKEKFLSYFQMSRWLLFWPIFWKGGFVAIRWYKFSLPFKESILQAFIAFLFRSQKVQQWMYHTMSNSSITVQWQLPKKLNFCYCRYLSDSQKIQT